MKKNILIYLPSNKRSVALETIILETNKYHSIKVLTLQPRGDIHRYLESKGVECFSSNISNSNFLKRFWIQVKFLVSFSKKNGIDVIWSHLHPCNLFAVFAQFFIKAKVIIFRHHFHAQIKHSGKKGLNKNELIVEYIINSLAKKIIVPSKEVYDGMVKYEGVPKSKIEIIPYLYHFDSYPEPDSVVIQTIRGTYPAQLIVLMAMRMIKLKRHMLVLPVLNKLIKENNSLQVLLLDDGEERSNLLEYITTENLDKNIHFIGYKSNIMDYLGACDVVLHPSATEASSSLIKEAGLLGKAVIVCDGVGDFSDYIINNRNGFLLTHGNEAEEVYAIFHKIINNEIDMVALGVELRKTVLEKFSVNDISLSKYLNTLH